MAKNQGSQSRLEQGRRSTRIRRETQVRGSMGEPASGRENQKVSRETDLFEKESTRDRESVRGARGEEAEPRRRTSGAKAAKR